MNAFSKVCIAAGAGLGICVTGPAWISATVVGVVTAGAVIIWKK